MNDCALTLIHHKFYGIWSYRLLTSDFKVEPHNWYPSRNEAEERAMALVKKLDFAELKIADDQIIDLGAYDINCSEMDRKWEEYKKEMWDKLDDKTKAKKTLEELERVESSLLKERRDLLHQARWLRTRTKFNKRELDKQWEVVKQIDSKKVDL